MPRPFRCRLMIHKWVVKQEASDSPRYVGCARCDAIKMVDFRPEAMPGEGAGKVLLFDDDPHDNNR